MTDHIADQSPMEFLEVSPRTTAFIDVMARLDAREIASQTEDDVMRDKLVAEMLEPDASAELEKVLLHGEPETISRQRRAILAIRTLDLFEEGVITEDDIAKKLAQLPTHPKYRPEVEEFTEKYFTRIGAYLAVSSLAIESAQQATSTEISPAMSSEVVVQDKKSASGDLLDGADNKPNIDKLAVTIRSFKDYAIQIGDQAPISLLRDTQVKQKGSEWELKIAKLRYDALKFIYSVGPEVEKLTTIDILSAVLPNEKHSTGLVEEMWQFLDTLTTTDGSKLVEVWKPSPDARIRYYKAGSARLTFEETDTYSGYSRPSLFMLPNNRILTGRTAKIANAFMASSQEKPFKTADIPESGIFTEDELATFEKGSTYASSLASAIRSELEESGCSEAFVLHKVGDEEAGPRNSAYWLEYVGDNQELYAHFRSKLERLEDIQNDEFENNFFPRVMLKPLSTWLANQSEKFQSKNIQPYLIDTETATDADVEGKVEISELDLFVLLGNFHRAARNEKVFEQLIQGLPPTDSRWKFIEYFVMPAGEDKTGADIPTIERILDAYPHIDYRIPESFSYAIKSLIDNGTFNLQTRDKQKRIVDQIGISFYSIYRSANGTHGPLENPSDILRYFSSRIDLLNMATGALTDFRASELYRIMEYTIAESYSFATQQKDNEAFSSRTVRRKFNQTLFNQLKKSYSI